MHKARNLPIKPRQLTFVDPTITLNELTQHILSAIPPKTDVALQFVPVVVCIHVNIEKGIEVIIRWDHSSYMDPRDGPILRNKKLTWYFQNRFLRFANLQRGQNNQYYNLN